MNPTIIVQPTEEPVEIDELRDHLRTPPEDDELLLGYLTAARRHVEEIAGIALLTQTLEWAMDQFPSGNGYSDPWGSIILPRPPLQSITSIKYFDLAGVQQTIAGTDYTANTRAVPGRADLAYGKWWPAARYIPNSIIVTYVAGYATTADVPEELKQVLKLIAGTLYEQREDLVDGTAPAATGLVRQLLTQHRVWACV